MKIAIPTQEGTVDSHFGHCAYYTIFEIENGKVVSKSLFDSPRGCGCKSNVAETFKEIGVTHLLAGNMGQGAVNVISAQGIAVIRGCEGNVDEVVTNFIAGKITDDGQTCSHHHDDGHQCSH